MKNLKDKKKSKIENQKIGEEIIAGEHESMEEVKTTIKKCDETIVKTEQTGTERKEHLQKRLEYLKLVEEKQLEFSGIVQDLNVILDDSMNSLVEGVTSSSVSEIEKKKIQSHNDVLNKYNEQESKKSNLEKLHKEVTELGDNSGKFSSLSFNDISEKHNKVGVELNKRTEELEKEKRTSIITC